MCLYITTKKPFDLTVDESAGIKQEPKESETTHETTYEKAQAESTEQIRSSDHDTEGSGGNQPQEPEVEQLEGKSSAEEATEDQKDPADIDPKQTETSRPGTDQSTTKKKDKVPLIHSMPLSVIH